MRRPHWFLALTVLLWLPALARAQAPTPAPEASRAGEAPVALEKLLKLPDSLDYSVERRSGATRGEWRERFRKARADREAAQAALRASQAELQETAEEGDWTFTPPGLPGGASGAASGNYRMRQEIRRHRDEIARAEKRLADLDVEANLAGVPEDWRR